MPEVGFNGYQPGVPASTRRAFFDIRRVFERLNSRLTAIDGGGGEAMDWHDVGTVGEPAFSGTWVNFAGGFQSLRFRKVGDRVRIEGLVKDGALGSTIFVLPVGYRPVARHVFPAIISDVLGRVDVQPSGVVNHVAGGGATTYLTVELEFTTS